MTYSSLSKESFPLQKSVFVSSTFRDMQKERDILHNRVVPELNEFARKYGGSIQFTDLRWGVSTTNLESEEGAKKVLKVCLDEINHCRPYMIVLLGDRYGWTPDISLITNASKEMQYNPDITAENPISVTELEIRFGALDNSDQLDRCLFYFREQLPEGKMSAEQKKTYAAENDADKRRMANLKDAIRKKGGRVFEYHADWDETTGVTGLEEFTAKVTDDIRQLLLNDWGEAPKELTWQDRELISDRVFIAEKCSHFVGRADAVSYCKQFVEKGDKKLLIIKGKSGSGKSSLMCHLAQAFDDKIHTSISVFCGNSTYAASAWQVLQSLVYRFENLLGITEHFGADESKKTRSLEADDNKSLSLQDWRDKLAELIGYYIHTTQKHPVILIDALDQLLQDDMAKDLEFLPDTIQNGASVIISCLSDYSIAPHSPLLKQSEEWSLPEFTPDDMRVAIDGILKANGKELDKRVIDKLTAMAENQTILYISFALQRLMMFDEDDFAHIYQLENSGVNPDDAICQYMLEVLDKLPENLEDMCVALIDETGERINPVLVDVATDLLAVSRYGLRVTDLADIFAAHGLEWNTIDFTLLKRYLSSNFMELEDGRINFTHKSIRAGLKNKTPNRAKYEQWIFEHLKGLDADDPVKVFEMVYHTYLVDKKEYLVEYLSEIVDSHSEMLMNITASATHDLCLSDTDNWFAAVAHYAGKNDDSSCVLLLLRKIYNLCSKSIEESRVLFSIVFSLQTGLAEIPSEKKTAYTLLDLSESLNFGGNLLRLQGQYDKALDMYRKALEICERLSSDSPTSYSLSCLSYTLACIGGVLEILGTYDEALEMLQRSLKIREQLSNNQSTPEALRTLSLHFDGVSNIFFTMGKYDEALEMGQRSLEIHERLSSDFSTHESLSELSASLNNMGLIFERRGDFDKAFEMLQRSLKIREQLSNDLSTPESLSDLSDSLNNVGAFFEVEGYSDKALEMFQRSLEIRERLSNILTTPHSLRRLADSMDSVGTSLKTLGMYDKALDMYQRSLEIRERLSNDFSTPESLFELSASLNNVGLVHVALGMHYNMHEQYNNALEMFQRSLRIREQLSNDFPSSKHLHDVSHSLNNILRLLKILGRDDEASEIYLRLEEVHKLLEKDNDEDGTGAENDERKIVALYKMGAEHGSAVAQCRLGECYEQGFGVEKDERKAVEWYQKAAKQGYAAAQYHLGACYSNGTGVRKNDRKSAEWLTKAAEQGYAKAQHYLAGFYYNGTGVKKDKRKAVEWLTKAAEQGYAEAQYILGMCYDSGDGIEKNEKKAVEWFEKAALQGHAPAQCALGWCYYYGDGVPQDMVRAAELFQEAAEQGDSDAQSALSLCRKDDSSKTKKNNAKLTPPLKAKIQIKGDFNYSSGDTITVKHDTALSFSANPIDSSTTYHWEGGTSDNPRSVIREGIGPHSISFLSPNEHESFCYLTLYVSHADGRRSSEKLHIRIINKEIGGVVTNPPELGRNPKPEIQQCYNKAVSGIAAEQNKLGEYYETGTGVEKNLNKAFFWYQISAKGEYAEAQFNLGRCYHGGYGTPQDKIEAVRWYKRAADMGDNNAQLFLAMCYENGIGINQDEDKALELYTKAANAGIYEACDKLWYFYYSGRLGVLKDKNKKEYWFNQASRVKKNELNKARKRVRKEYKKLFSWLDR